jgi:predicted DNA-binding transcriptional regulator YafY
VAVALGTSLIREMWGQLYHEAAQGALAKLENVLPDEQRQEIGWAQRSLAAAGMNRADIELLTPLLKMLRKAVRENYSVDMTYHSSSNPHGEPRELDPYSLIHRAGWWYVVGFCHLRQDMRSFRVDRIADLNLTMKTFSVPVDFDIYAYLAQEWTNNPRVIVRMRFAEQFAHLAKVGRGYWELFEEQPDGAITVTFNAPDIYAAASNALAYGPAVTVLEPLEVRKMVHEWARAAAELYEP